MDAVVESFKPVFRMLGGVFALLSQKVSKSKSVRPFCRRCTVDD